MNLWLDCRGLVFIFNDRSHNLIYCHIPHQVVSYARSTPQNRRNAAVSNWSNWRIAVKYHILKLMLQKRMRLKTRLCIFEHWEGLRKLCIAAGCST